MRATPSMAGQCAALNVGHWESDAIRRGDTVTLPGYFSPEAWYVCRLRLLPRDKLRLKQGGAVKFHTGTTEVNAAVYNLEEGELREPGDYLIQVRTQTPIVAGPGDHFILRSLSPMHTIGGGTIVEAVSGRMKRTRPQVLEELQRRADAVRDDARFVEYCIRTAPSLTVDEAQLATRAKVLPGRLQEILGPADARPETDRHLRRTLPAPRHGRGSLRPLAGDRGTATIATRRTVRA